MGLPFLSDLNCDASPPVPHKMNSTIKSVLVVDKAGSEQDLSNGWYRVEVARSTGEALDRVLLQPMPCLVLVDMDGTRDGGLEIISQLRQARPSLPIIMLSAMSDPRDVVRAIRLGAENCVTKPNTSLALKTLIEEQLSSLSAPDNGDHEDACVDRLDGERFFLALSPAMRRLREQIRQLATIDVPVLCLGESGSGKEVVARLIHLWSRRANRTFMKVNCAALPGELLESELFGYERGAFTGADRSKPGKFELTNEGTILLDEIGELPTSLQAKLLHVLQDREFTRLGGRAKIKVNVRPLAATNVDVRSAISAKTFREDLYYRLGTFVLHVPPLRERREDIPVLLRRYISHYAKLHGVADRPLTYQVLESCSKYEWPGNVRELENFARRYLVLGEPFPGVASDALAGNPSPGTTRQNSPQSQQAPDFKTHMRGLTQEAESLAIRRALENTHWNKRAAAQLLKISYKSLLAKIRQHQL